MSERYARCRTCQGLGIVKDTKEWKWTACLDCHESGFSGNAEHFMASEQEKDPAWMDAVRGSLDAIDRGGGVW